MKIRYGYFKADKAIIETALWPRLVNLLALTDYFMLPVMSPESGYHKLHVYGVSPKFEEIVKV
jgi:hypothetical protein